MCFRIQYVAATQAESHRSTPTMLSILSTTVNSNEIKWMQNKTQAKKHNFPNHCPKTGANPKQAECHPDPEQAKRAGRGIACPELVEWTSRLTFLNNSACPGESFTDRPSPRPSNQIQTHNPSRIRFIRARPRCRACQQESTPMISNGCKIRPR
jgi:hypothetical protein